MWILILIVTMYGRVSVTTAEYNSYTACDQARTQITKNLDGALSPDLHAICTSKGDH